MTYRKLPRSARRPRRARLGIETLETRVVPTIAFSYNPLFGPDQVATYDPNQVLNRPFLYLVFDGSYWNGTGATARDSMTTAVKSIISGTYLSGLNQYEAPGKDPTPTLLDTTPWVDTNTSSTRNLTSNVPNFNATMQNYLQSAIDDSSSPLLHPGNFDHPVIYIVVTAPNSSNYVGGWNYQFQYDAGTVFSEPMNAIWVGTGVDGSGNVLIDRFTRTFSHELSEAISAPIQNNANPKNTILTPTGVVVQPGSSYFAHVVDGNSGALGGRQVADFEADQGYVYRLNGYDMNAYWSVRDQAFIIPDDNAVTLNVTPLWIQDAPGSSQYDFTGQFLVKPNGLSVSLTTGGGKLNVSILGSSFNFDDARIKGIVVTSPSPIRVNGSLSTQGSYQVDGDTLTAAAQLVTDGEGTLFELWQVNHEIYRYLGGIWDIIDPVGDAQSIAVDFLGDLFVLSFTNHGVWRWQGGTSFINVDPVNDVDSIAVDAAGTLYVHSFVNHGIWKYLDIASFTNIDPVNDTQTMAVDAAGNLYSFSSVNHGVWQYQAGVWTNIEPANDVQSILTDGLGTLYFLSSVNHGVWKRYLTNWLSIVSANVASMSVDAAGELTIQAAAFGVSVTVNRGQFAVTGDNNAHALTLRETGTPLLLQKELLVGSAFLTGVSGTLFTNIAFQLGNGMDSLKIDDSNGDPIPGITVTYTGGTGSNTLLGPGSTNSWMVRGSNAGTLNSTLSFSGVANLIGGAGSDTFFIRQNSGVTGSIDGGGGNNTLDYSVYGARVVVSLAAGAASGVHNLSAGGIANIQKVVGSLTGNLAGANSSLLVGPDVSTPTRWIITDANGGGLVLPDGHVFEFQRFPNLTGASGPDTFEMHLGSRLDGSVDGGGGSNTLDYSGYDGQAIVSLAADAASLIKNMSGSGIAHIQSFIGSPINTSLLVGSDSDDTWTLTGANQGTVSATTYGPAQFAGFKYLTGGASTDRFVFKQGASLSGAIDGRGGVNTLDYTTYAARTVIDLSNYAATAIHNASSGSVYNIQKAIGSTSNSGINNSAANELVGYLGTTPGYSSVWNLTGVGAGNINGLYTFSGFPVLAGTTSSDSFKVLSASASFQSIDGGATGAVNTLDWSSFGSPVAVNLNTGTEPSAGIFYRMQVLDGNNSGANSLIGPSAGATFNVTASNAGNVNGTTSFAFFQNLTGGAGNDRFIFANGVSLSYALDGGGGTNTVDYSAWTTGVTVNLTTNLATNIGTTIKNIQIVLGGLGNDTLTGAASGSLLVGGANADALNGGAGRSILIGGVGNDIIKGGPNDDLLIAGTTSFDNNLAALLAIFAEWQSNNTYATRVAELRAGTGLAAGNKLIFGTTVNDDGGQNVLTGDVGTPVAGELDWFFANITAGHDRIGDKGSGELIN